MDNGRSPDASHPAENTDADNSSAVQLQDLVRDHYESLYRFAWRLSGSSADAEDLVQQTYLVAQRTLHQLRDPEAARAWLFTITRNAFLKTKRAGKQFRAVSLDDTGELAQTSEPPATIDSDELQAVLNELPEEFRTPLILYYFEEFSYKDIARQMDVPIGTVMSRLARAKQHLRSRLTTEVSASFPANEA